MRKKSTRKALKDIEKSITFVNKVITKEYANSGITVNSRITNHPLIGYPVVSLSLSVYQQPRLQQYLFQGVVTKENVRAQADLLLEKLEEVEALEAFHARKAKEQETRAVALPSLD